MSVRVEAPRRYLNAINESESPLGFGPHSILIAPNLFVKDRLLQDFCPPYGQTSVFLGDPVVPPAFDQIWNTKRTVLGRNG